MNGKNILIALGNVDDQYIKEAEPLEIKGKKYIWQKWVAMAACVCLIVFAMFLFRNTDTSDELNGSELQMITFSEMFADGTGFESYTVYDISELKNSNPWYEGADLNTLPVYKNTLSFDENYNIDSVDWEKMRTMLYDVASRLGIKADDLIVYDDKPNKEEEERIREKYKSMLMTPPDSCFEPTRLYGKANGVLIDVYKDMVISIWFQSPIDLPESIDFRQISEVPNDDYSSYEDVQLAAEYLMETYPELIKMDEPIINIYGGNYDFNHQQHYRLKFYEGSGDLTAQIVNYSFNNIVFYPNEYGQIDLVRIYDTDLSNKVCDYPIISVNDAKNLLLKGKYFTTSPYRNETAPYKFPGMEYVAKVELVYRNFTYDEYHVPFYCFFVELPEEKREGDLKVYGAYYVPAVHESYITNFSNKEDILRTQ